MLKPETLKSLKQVRDTLETLRTEIESKRASLNDLQNQREEVRAAPPDREQVGKVLAEAISGLYAHHTSRLGRFVGYYMADRIKNRDTLAEALRSRADPVDPDIGMITLLLPALKAGIPAALAELNWPENAISEEEREVRISELNPKIEKLKTELAALQALADQLKL